MFIKAAIVKSTVTPGGGALGFLAKEICGLQNELRFASTIFFIPTLRIRLTLCNLDDKMVLWVAVQNCDSSAYILVLFN